MAASIADSGKGKQTASSANVESENITASGSNLVAYALAGCGAGSPSAATGVKWGGSGGTSMTKISTDLNYSAYGYMNLWRLVNPTATTSTFYASWGGGQDESWVIGLIVQDCDQTTPNGTVAEANGTSGPVTVNAISSTGLLVIDFASLLDISGSNPYFTIGASQTYSQNFGAGAISAYEEAASSYETASGASTTMSHTLNDAPDPEWGIFALALNNAAAGPSGPDFLPLFRQKTNTLLRM